MWGGVGTPRLRGRTSALPVAQSAAWGTSPCGTVSSLPPALPDAHGRLTPSPTESR